MYSGLYALTHVQVYPKLKALKNTLTLAISNVRFSAIYASSQICGDTRGTVFLFVLVANAYGVVCIGFNFFILFLFFFN